MNMALYIDGQTCYFSAVQDSGRLYLTKSLIWFLPYKKIQLIFGNQICCEAYLYIYELQKQINTEFGPLKIECRITKSFPFYNYHFILTGSTTKRKNIIQQLQQ